MAFNPNCCECGRFVPWGRNVSYTPFGTTYDTEPPEEEFFHVECWEALSEDRKNLVRRVAWLGPTVCKEG